jgi:hypothetical protein
MKTVNHAIEREKNQLLFVASMERIATEAKESTRIEMAKSFLKRKGLIATDYIECFESDYFQFLNMKYS